MRNQRVRPAVFGIAVGFTLAVGAGASWNAQAQERAAATTGARLFTEHGCYGCHQIKGLGTQIGPDLTRVGAKYSERDLVR
jgi:cytochrome c551/c552